MSGAISNLYTYNISSVNRIQNGSDTDNFDYFINLPEDLNIFSHISITNIQIPKTWYTVRDPLNNFILNENGNQITITFPEGNYDAISLFQTFQSLLNANSPTGYTYTVLECNTNTLGQQAIPDIFKIQVQNNAPLMSSISFIFDYNTSIIPLLLGYNEGVNIQLPNQINIAPQLYNLNFESQIYMISNIVNSDNNDNNYSNNTVCVVNCANIPYGGYCEQSYDIIANMKKFNNTGNRVFNFQLQTDNNESSFFLNYVDMKFTLCFFKYTPNINYYLKSSELLELISYK